jgi:L-iditol 2-dehydrogenase
MVRKLYDEFPMSVGRISMKAAFAAGSNKVSIEDRPIPTVGPGDVLVKMRACGVCGTDVEKVRGLHITSPMLGHEVVGQVVEVGEEVKSFQVGERVFVHHHVPCYVCHYCRRGDYTMCESFVKTTIEPCGFAEYFKVPRTNVERGAILKLPSGMRDDVATLVEPTACCVRGLSKFRIWPGDDFMVIGCGPIGLTHIRLLTVFGAGRVFGSDIVGFRLKAAKKLGAAAVFDPRSEDVVGLVKQQTDGRGTDGVVVSVGASEAILQAIDLVRKGGTVVLFGAPHKGAMLSYDVSKVFLKEVKIIPSYSTTELETNAALELMVSGRIDLSSLITHRFKLKDTGEAIQCAADAKDSLKVVVLSS